MPIMSNDVSCVGAGSPSPGEAIPDYRLPMGSRPYEMPNRLRKETTYSEIEEVGELADDGTSRNIPMLPEFVIDNIEVATRAIGIANEEVATNNLTVVIPLEE